MSSDYLIMVPGLGDLSWLVSWSSMFLKRKLSADFETYIMPWQGDEQDFDPKLKRLLSRIDELSQNGKNVSLLGISAGGSAVLNALCERPEKIHKVINLCGRLREGKRVQPTLEQASVLSPAFSESVIKFESNEKNLSRDDRQKVLTIRPFVDEAVPISTVSLEGATNVQIVSVEHMLSIALAMTLYSKTIVNFLEDEL